MANPFIGEIKLVPYNFAPLGWAFCDGSLVSIAQNTALFALLGTTYGGDGQTTFALPDLRGRVALHMGSQQGNSYTEGEQGGVESVTLTNAQMPAHNHPLAVSDQPGTAQNPVGQNLAVSTQAGFMSFAPGGGGTMPANTVGQAGGNQPHSNLQPYLALNYIIAVEGIFPSRN